nr:hypothetical protein [Halomonas sp.]
MLRYHYTSHITGPGEYTLTTASRYHAKRSTDTMAMEEAKLAFNVHQSQIAML